MDRQLLQMSRICVVDDDKAFLDSMRRLLKSLNHGVSVFPSAAAFLESPELWAADCLIADVNMPDMTGMELYAHLIEAGHEIATILVTAYPDAVLQEQMLKLGVCSYLRKPFEEAALIASIGTALSRGKAAREP